MILFRYVERRIKPMRHVRIVLVILFLGLIQVTGRGQDPKYVTVSLVQLIAVPERFSGRVVETGGYLAFQTPPRDVGVVLLSISEEDVKYRLGNDVLVRPSEQMLKEREKLDHAYVTLRGKVALTPTGVDSPSIVTITEIQLCELSVAPPPRTGRPLPLERDDRR
jgi:hypothetical protein